MPKDIEGIVDRKRIQRFDNSIRIDLTLFNKFFICSWLTHHAEIRVKDVSLDLSMSTVIGLGDLAEDEIISAPMPVTVDTFNVFFFFII